MPLVERECKTCGRCFCVKANIVVRGGGRFCQKSCARTKPKVQSACKTCGKPLELTARALELGLGKYCSRKCRGLEPKTPAEFWLTLLSPTASGCREWSLGRNDDGYGKIKVNGKTRLAHRMAFELYWGVTLPSWVWVLHHCDNPPCCNPDHLWIGECDTNKHDEMEKERHAFGSRNGGSKLTEEQVKQIREQWNTGQFTEKQLAAAYGVSVPTVSRIKRLAYWNRTALIPMAKKRERTV